MKIYIGTDHAGFEFKEALISYLSGRGYDVEDKGAYSYKPDDDYPDFVVPVARAVAADPESLGIVLGGSGQGEVICANKVHGIRAALFYGPEAPKTSVDVEGTESNDPFEVIKLARLHNNANVLSLGSRFMTEPEIQRAVMAFLETPFSGEERHARRVEKVDNIK
jgi:ribose 5-phosphate isomerase B